MPSKIASILGLSTDEEEKLDEPATKIKTIGEWISETIEATKDTGLFKSLDKVGEAAKEWSGTIKFAAKLIELMSKETDPKTIGWLASTIAYKKTSEDAIREFGRPANRIPYSGPIVSERLKHLRLEDPSIMNGFSMTAPSSHPFLKAADTALTAALEIAGYAPSEIRSILRSARARFKSSLQEVISGEDREKFAPFAQWLALDTDDGRADKLLRAHAEAQRVDFEDRPALGIEPFAIADVYIPAECGALQWHEINDKSIRSENLDPFAEDSAKRQDLMHTVQSFIENREFRDAIMIQGVAGAGKSTFTKQLCIALQSKGLIPIRIPLQHLRVDIALFEAIEEILTKFSGPDVLPPRKAFLYDKVFTERVKVGEAEVSPYVLIFDGWDEISLSAAEGFQQRVERLLDLIQSTLLQQNRNVVRVVLTGRPSGAIAKANFLRAGTPILTIRPLSPDQLERYISSVATSILRPSFTDSTIDTWPLIDLRKFHPLLRRYRKAFPNNADLEVFGQPLLAHLAVKVAAATGESISRLITPPTTLYRSLVDLTCKRGGKHPNDLEATNKTARIEGSDLRSLLHGAASAITAHGSESISGQELELRLETLGVGTDVFPTSEKFPTQYPLMNLMISFFFKGVHEQGGCEFLHKSFREYLAAEAIVEVLKQFGREASNGLTERHSDEFWKDFPQDDLRWWLSRKLGEMAAAQWQSREIRRHLRGLIRWEVGRATNDTTRTGASDLTTQPISAEQWNRVRDGICDLWDWWGEGVHLRPKPQQKAKLWTLAPPYAIELVERAMRRSNYHVATPPRPLRIATVDAHFGVALFGLCTDTHSAIADHVGWSMMLERDGAEATWAKFHSGPRRYQVSAHIEEKQVVQFAPSGMDPEYFKNYAARINGAGIHLNLWSRSFPGGENMKSVCLAGANLGSMYLVNGYFYGCNFRDANLIGAEFQGSTCDSSTFSRAHCFRTSFFEASLSQADLTQTHLYQADLRHTELSEVKGLTQEQLDMTVAGSSDLPLPPGLQAPGHWTSTSQDEDDEALRVGP